MGDVLSLIEKVEENIDQKKAEEMQRKLIDNEFTLDDSTIATNDNDLPSGDHSMGDAGELGG
jgi:signal recognition particle GTPase